MTDPGKRTATVRIEMAVDMASGEMCLRSPDILFKRLGVDP